MSEYRLGIVIIGYKNTEGISRLLKSLDNVDFCGDSDVKLIFSIDYSGEQAVENLANEYDWKNGEKIIRAYQKNLGLRNHIISCGNYMGEYDLDAIIVLEDDLIVSPAMYSYSKCSVEYYYNNDSVAGVSLYKHEININAKHPFVPINDGLDIFFLQYASSWGQIWFRDKWKDFISWYNDKEYEKIDTQTLPQNILGWTNSWLKFHIMYCIAKNKYFVYPHTSLTTNCSDPGAHRNITETSYQVPLLNVPPKHWKFCEIEQTESVYDAFFENKTISINNVTEGVCIDLHGAKKSNLRYVLSTKRLPYRIIREWGLKIRPIELNIKYDIDGTGIYLYDTFLAESNHPKHNKLRFEYDLKGLNIISKDALVYIVSTVLDKTRNKLRLKKKKKLKAKKGDK